MIQLPLEYRSSAVASSQGLGPWSIRSGENSSVCSVPPEFGGPGGGFSPEDLYLQALINCFVGTFQVYAKGSKLQFQSLEVSGILTIDKNSAGAIRMQGCLLEIHISGVDRPDRVQALAEKVLRDGFILNSVKTEIRHNLTVNPAAKF